MAWICEKCKHVNSNDISSRCEICGNKRDIKSLVENTTKTNATANGFNNSMANSTPMASTPIKSTNNNNNITIILLVVIVLLFIVIAGMFIVNIVGNKNYQSEPSVAVVTSNSEEEYIQDDSLIDTQEVPVDTTEETTIVTTTEQVTTVTTTVSTTEPVQEEVIIPLETQQEESKPKFKCYALDCTWEEARKDAESKGGHLATFTTDEEYQEMLNAAKQSGLKYLWIGGTTTLTDGGVSVNWCTGEDKTILADTSYWFYDSKNDILEPSGTDRNTGTVEPYIMLWYVQDKWGLLDNSDEAKTVYKGKQKMGYICEFE